MISDRKIARKEESIDDVKSLILMLGIFNGKMDEILTCLKKIEQRSLQKTTKPKTQTQA